MEQQRAELPLEWLSSRRSPELHWLEKLCREAAREQRCIQRRLQEVEEAMAPEQNGSYAVSPKPETKLEQLSRRLNAADAELRRYETRMFAYERTMVALRNENAELTARCEELQKEVDELSAALMRKDTPAQTEQPPLPVVELPQEVEEEEPALEEQAEKPAEYPAEAVSDAEQKPKRTKLEHLSDEVLARLAELMPKGNM